MIDVPFLVCPVDLRKLHYSIGFNVDHWYRLLLEFSRSTGFWDEVRWLERRRPDACDAGAHVRELANMQRIRARCDSGEVS